ncbi:Gfo/Idh/MocA family protein [Nocardia goodfellowii]
MTITIGVLGAANIVPLALLHPAAELDGVEVTAVAARDPARAAEYAATHKIPRALESYEDVLNAPDVDAVYIPTPAATHGLWMRRALAAGKHILCEKPFTANAEEAQTIAELARASGVVTMEAFHTLYHPMWARVTDLLASGAIGRIDSATGSFIGPHVDRTDIRWQTELGGGALMDLGVYPVRMLRHLFGTPEVRQAEAEDVDGIDAAMTARLEFGAGVVAEVVTSMRDGDPLGAEMTVHGSAGSLHIRSPYLPHFYGQITMVTESGTTTETGHDRSTYSYQLQHFRDAINEGTPVRTDACEAAATMRIIDDIYRAAGMKPRTPLA